MRERPLSSPGFVLGVIIFAAGVLLFLDAQGIFNLSRVFVFWPLAVVGLGMACLIQSAGAHRFLGVLLVVVGVVLQLGQFNLVRLDFEQLWPLALIGVGGALLWQAIEAQASPKRGRAGSSFNRAAIFGGGDWVGGEQFEGGEALAIFGGYKIDLREAGMAGAAATIQASAMYGGVEIRVPETWNVCVRGLGMFGGYNDHTQHPRDSAKAPQLTVTGFALFGGVEVKN